MMLLTGINRQAIAQKISPNSIDKDFEVPNGFLSNRFSIDLGKGNTLQVEVMDLNDIARFKNIDSILTVFFKDIVPLQDSLMDELAAKRIDYLIDAAGRKKIRISNFKPVAASFVLRQGEMSALKTEQDTLNIIGVVNEPPSQRLQKILGNIRYYRLSFYVNNLNELKNAEAKSIGEKITAFSSKKKWVQVKENDWKMKNGDKSISSKTPNGTVSGNGNYLESIFAISMQNYKNNFVPSVSAGFSLVFNNGITKKHIGFSNETHFLFTKDMNGDVKRFLNVFTTISYKQRNLNEKSAAVFHLNPDFSLSYLIENRGNFYDKNTFRLGFGRVNLDKGAVNLEPCFYFNNFFKNTTPGLRLNVGF